MIEADAQLNVGQAAQPVHVGWQFYDGGAHAPVPTHQTLVIDARDLAGIAAVSADDPRCTAAGQVLTCVDKDESQPPYVDFTVRADPGAALGATGTLKYTVSAEHGTGATAQAKVVVGVPELAVGKVPDVTHAKVGSRIELPLRLRNTGDLATDRRIMLRWEEVGGLAFDRKFSNCTYGDGDDPVEPGSQASVTCVFTAPVAAGATVELSSPLTATVGAHVLTAVTDYSAELLKPGVQPGGGSEPGTGPELTLVPASGSGNGFESGATGQVRVSADNSADLAATAAVTPRRTGGEWTLTLNAVNHGPASAYGIGNKAVALVDVVLPKGTVATGNAFEGGGHALRRVLPLGGRRQDGALRGGSPALRVPGAARGRRRAQSAVRAVGEGRQGLHRRQGHGDRAPRPGRHPAARPGLRRRQRHVHLRRVDRVTDAEPVRVLDRVERVPHPGSLGRYVGHADRDDRARRVVAAHGHGPDGTRRHHGGRSRGTRLGGPARRPPQAQLPLTRRQFSTGSDAGEPTRSAAS